MPPKSKRSSRSSQSDKKKTSPQSLSANKCTPAYLALSKIAKKPGFKAAAKKKPSAGRLPSLENGVDNLLSPAQLAEDEQTPQARPARSKLPSSTTSRLPTHVKKRPTKESPIDPDVMHVTEDVPWTRPSTSRRGFPLPRPHSSELRRRDVPAVVDAFEGQVSLPERRSNTSRPAPHYSETPKSPEFANKLQQAEALLAGRTSTCTMPGSYALGGRKSYRTHLLDELLKLGYAFCAAGHELPPISDAERYAMMQSRDPTAVIQNYDDYGIIPREATTDYPAFKLPRSGDQAQVRRYWTNYDNMCRAAEKNAIEDWARTLFLRANNISEEELEYNENLQLVDHKYRIIRPLHRINPSIDDWYNALPDYDHDEMYDEIEQDIYDANGRNLGKPVRKLWKVVHVPHHVFKEDSQNAESALDAYWDYHDCGIIPKGVQKYILYPQRDRARGLGDLRNAQRGSSYDDEENHHRVTALRERQWKPSSLRRAEQLYLYEYCKCLRAKELDMTLNQFEHHLATGAIDPAWSTFTPVDRQARTTRQARSTTPTPAPIPQPTQQRAFYRPGPVPDEQSHKPANKYAGRFYRPASDDEQEPKPPAPRDPRVAKFAGPNSSTRYALRGYDRGSKRQL